MASLLNLPLEKYGESPWNENLNWLARIKFMNLFLYMYIHVVLNKNWKIYWSKQSFTGLGPEDRCSSWGLWRVDRKENLPFCRDVQCFYSFTKFMKEVFNEHESWQSPNTLPTMDHGQKFWIITWQSSLRIQSLCSHL